MQNQQQSVPGSVKYYPGKRKGSGRPHTQVPKSFFVNGRQVTFGSVGGLRDLRQSM